MESKQIERVGNNPFKAIKFLEEVDMKVKIEGLTSLIEDGHRVINVRDLEKKHVAQTTRILEYETVAESGKKVEVLINDIHPRPDENHNLVKKLKKIQKTMIDYSWQGTAVEEKVEETRRRNWESAVDNTEKKLAAVSRVEKYLVDRLEECIYVQVKQSVRDISEPSARLKKMIETTKSLTIGDQKKQRELMIRRLEDIEEALNNSELKMKINDMRIIKLQYSDSAKAEGLVIEIEDAKMITKLGEIMLGNGVDFSARTEFREKHKTRGQTFDKLAAEIEGLLDSAIYHKNRDKDGGGSRGMEISNMQATADQTMGMRATGSASTSGGTNWQQPICYRWEKDGKCRFGDQCRYHHHQDDKGAPPSRGGTGGYGANSSRGGRDRSPSTSRGRGGGDQHHYSTSSRDSRSGRRGDERDRSRSRERDRSRSRERGNDRRGRSSGGSPSKDRKAYPSDNRQYDRDYRRDSRRSEGNNRSDRDAGKSRGRGSSSTDDDDYNSRSSGESTPRNGGTPKKPSNYRN